MTGPPRSGLGALRRIAAPESAATVRRRSAASSAPSTSASGTDTSPTCTTTGCCACAGPATCCSRRRAPAVGGTAASVRRCAGSRTCFSTTRGGTRCASRWTWSSSSGRPGAEHLLAFYPGPGGATESELDLAAWDDISSANPVLDDARARRRGGAAARVTTTATRATWCRSTSATSWSAWCAAGGPGSAAAPRCGARSRPSSAGSTTARPSYRAAAGAAPTR